MKIINSKEKLFVFDLDGTITRVELLPRIAENIGIAASMAKLTKDTMAGLIPFEESFRHRVDLLSRVPIDVVSDICASAPLHEEIVQFIQDNRERCVIATGNLDVWVGALARRIGALRLFSSTGIVEGRYLKTLTHILRKYDVLSAFDGREIIAIGDGHNDAELIEHADVGVAFGAAHAPASSLLEVCTHAIFDEAALCRFLRQL